MFAPAFMCPHAHRVTTSATDAMPTRGHAEKPSTAAGILARHTASEWIGTQGEQLRLRVVVEHVTAARRTFTYVLRVEGTNDLLEWSTQRRYGITEGERLALSGLVKAHTTRDATRVTVLRDCFNPLRTT